MLFNCNFNKSKRQCETPPKIKLEYKIQLNAKYASSFLPNSFAAFSATFSTVTIALELFSPILHKLSKVRDDLNERESEEERKNKGIRGVRERKREGEEGENEWEKEGKKEERIKKRRIGRKPELGLYRRINCRFDNKKGSYLNNGECLLFFINCRRCLIYVVGSAEKPFLERDAVKSLQKFYRITMSKYVRNTMKKETK